MPSITQALSYLPGVFGYPFRQWERGKAREAQQQQLVEQAQRLSQTLPPGQARHLQNLMAMGNLTGAAEYMGQATSPEHQLGLDKTRSEIAENQAQAMSAGRYGSADSGFFQQTPEGVMQLPSDPTVDQQRFDAEQRELRFTRAAIQDWVDDPANTSSPVYGAVKSNLAMGQYEDAADRIAMQGDQPALTKEAADLYHRQRQAQREGAVQGGDGRWYDIATGEVLVDAPRPGSVDDAALAGPGSERNPITQRVMNKEIDALDEWWKQRPDVQQIRSDADELYNWFDANQGDTGFITGRTAIPNEMHELLDRISVRMTRIALKESGEIRPTDMDFLNEMKAQPSKLMTEATNMRRLRQVMDRIDEFDRRALAVRDRMAPYLGGAFGSGEVPAAAGAAMGAGMSPPVDLDLDAMGIR